MAGKYAQPISIEKAIRNIDERKFLLPAIQRKFTWDTDQICVLFDSIMRGYPINTMMMWEVSSKEIKDKFKFYSFLVSYCQRFKEDNEEFNPTSDAPFMAVIDGQQRLTSIYIGLKGTYAYKIPRKQWPDTEDDSILPPRRLYLNLDKALEANESMMEFDFQFLTDAEHKSSEDHWFRVGEILKFNPESDAGKIFDLVTNYLADKVLKDSTFARDALRRLYEVTRVQETIHYYNEDIQNMDRVLDIFIRTNSGGTPLSFSNLLMAIAVNKWKSGARDQIDGLVKSIRTGKEMGFSIDRDWVLKACLMLTPGDIRFRVENFDDKRVDRIEQEWPEIKKCILATFKLLADIGMQDKAIRAKNAAIPIAYYLYKKMSGNKPLYSSITKQAFHSEERVLIQKWLIMSLLKGVFGGQADTVLSGLRNVIDANLKQDLFPLSQIIEAYKENSSKNLRFDDDFIAGLLKTEKDDPDCFLILALLLPDLDYTRALEIDHLHPASAFEKKKLEAHEFLKNDENQMTFYVNDGNWNTIANLHLLEKSKNRSKLATPLKDWLADMKGVSKETFLIPEDASLEFGDFMKFIEKRTQNLSDMLKNLGKTA